MQRSAPRVSCPGWVCEPAVRDGSARMVLGLIGPAHHGTRLLWVKFRNASHSGQAPKCSAKAQHTQPHNQSLLRPRPPPTPLSPPDRSAAGAARPRQCCPSPAGRRGPAARAPPKPTWSPSAPMRRPAVTMTPSTPKGRGKVHTEGVEGGVDTTKFLGDGLSRHKCGNTYLAIPPQLGKWRCDAFGPVAIFFFSFLSTWEGP